MNFYIFIIFIIIGYVGCIKNINNNHTSISLKLIFYVLFILCGVSRIGHTQEYSDLTHYIDYFENDISTYFEPGYLLFTQFIRCTLGGNGTCLVFGVGLFISIVIYLCVFLLERNLRNNMITKEVFFLFSFFFFVYWGLAFESERIRIGMATSLLILSTTMMFCQYRYISYIPCILAIFFQYTTIIFVPVLFLIQKEISLPSKRTYIIWLICLIIFDFFVKNFNIFSSSFIFQYLQFVNLEQVDHYMEYEIQSMGSYSLQYFWYHLAPLLFLGGNFKDKRFNKGVLLYYIGLTLSSIFQSLSAGQRVADMFTIMIIFPLMFAFVGRGIRVCKYKQIAFTYIVIQAVMSANYLSLVF